MSRLLFALFALFAVSACALVKPQRGGGSTTTLGGAAAPTVVTTSAPENPKTPSTTTVEKTTTREFQTVATESTERSPQRAPSNAAVSVPSDRASASSVSKIDSPSLLRETVVERATTQTGAAQPDTARELGARLANMRGVQWVGVLLLIAGPLLGWQLGWFVNGCIAGGVGLLLIVLANVIPGNEAWFGLGGLLLIPLVCYAWYHGHHTATAGAAAAK